MKRFRPDHQTGFSLIELLVSVSVIGVLVALVMGSIGSIQDSARRGEAIQNMRSIGAALLIYCADNNGRLPGPLWPGQMPVYDPDREGRLVRELAGYLEIETPDRPRPVDLFIPPAYRFYPGAPPLETARTFVVNMAVELDGAILNPWGNLADTSSGGPHPLAILPGDVWALSDADQLHPRVSSAPWRANTPPGIIHGDRRLALFFGGHVAPVEEGDL